ncbi:MAG TPA: DedA family protein [Tepidisphaeraceae bacterium]|jgi:membrane protein DedA with SNARE-associated domain|nr:DedA family protein [Tepidisphaeraceae bacterium]
MHIGKLIDEWISKGGGAALFLVLFACGLGLPLPEDIPLITAGFLIYEGRLNFALAAFCAWCGIIGGDCMLYLLGRKFGHDVSKIPFIGRHVDNKRMARVEKWFERWGVWVVAIGRMFAGVRGAMVVVAGATRFAFFKFLIADGLAAIVSGGLFLFLGYKFAANRHRLWHLVHQIKGGMLLGLAALLVLIAFYVLWRKFRTPRGEQPGDQAPPPKPSAPQALRPPGTGAPAK